MYKIVTQSLIIALVSNISCFGFQDQSKPETPSWLNLLASQKRPFSYWMNSNGTIIFNHYPPDRNEQFDTRDFFLHRVIVDDLKLSSANQKEIAAAFDEFQKQTQQSLASHFDKLKQSNKQESAAAKQELGTRIREHQKRLDDKLKRILNNRQHKRLREIQFRFMINHNGFFQLLGNPTTQREFDIDLKVTPEMLNQQKKIAKSLYLKDREIGKKAADIFLESLNEEQVSIVKRRWNKTFNSKFTSLTLQLFLQLDSKIKARDVEIKSPFDIVKLRPRFDTDITGNCIFVDPKKFKFEITDLVKFRCMYRWFRSAHYKRDLDIIESQTEKFEQITKQWLIVKSEVNHEYGKKFNIKPRNLGTEQEPRLVYPLLNPKQYKEYERALAVQAKPFCDQFLEVLMPHQRKLLLESCRGTQIRSRGPLADLLWGDLGKALELDDKAKAELKKNADRARDFIKSEYIEAYKQAIEKLIGLAPAENSARLRSLLDEMPKNWTPVLPVFTTSQYLEYEFPKR